MKFLTISACLFLLYSVSAKECVAPKYALIIPMEGNQIAFQCEHGFDLLGIENSTCDEETGTYQGELACLPRYTDDDTGCGDMCPTDLSYLYKVVVGGDSEEEMLEMDELLMELGMSGKSPRKPSDIPCAQLCKQSIRTCLKMARQYRGVKKRCFKCHSRCGRTFWG